MSDTEKDTEEARRAKLVKTGVAVGIGSAAIARFALLNQAHLRAPRLIRGRNRLAASDDRNRRRGRGRLSFA